MTVKELIEQLSKQDPDMEVSIDGEGIVDQIQVETVEWLVHEYGRNDNDEDDDSTHLVNVVMLNKE